MRASPRSEALFGSVLIASALLAAGCGSGDEAVVAGEGGDGGSSSGGVSGQAPAQPDGSATGGEPSALTGPVPLPGEHKVVRLPMTTDGPKTLDPAQGSTTYDNRCASQIYQPLLQYKYLVRPFELEPLLLAEMPVIEDGGKLWRFRLKDGVTFTDDPCFPDGKGRELVTDDVLYSWKRLADPEYDHNNWWLVENTIMGFDDYKQEQSAIVQEGGSFDYEAPVAGMRKVDDKSFVVELVEPVQQFRWKLAMFQLSVVPREAVEHYGSRFSRHPVGTGPFRLESEDDWVPGKSLRLVRNEQYHEDLFPSEWMPEDEARGFHRYAGQRLPLVDEVQIGFYVQSQPMWLEFKAKRVAYSTVPDFGFDEYFRKSDGLLKRQFERKGLVFEPLPLLDFIFRAFNMQDDLLGGYTPERRALRQAICLSIDLDEMNRVYYNGECLVYDGPVPPGLDGFPEGGTAPVSYRGPDLEAARQKLRDAGYNVDESGMVTDLPTIEYYTSAGAVSEKMTALTQRNLEKVGIKLNPHFVDFSELIQAVDNKKAQMFSFAWGSDYPDAENNLALFYGPNESPGSNHFNYKRADIDEMYLRLRTMAPGPERTAMIEQMRDIIIEDAPFAGSMARIRRYLIYPWLRNYKPSETFYNFIKYWDVDMDHEDRSS